MTTILLVDDDIRILELVETHLLQHNYHVVKAMDGSDALTKLKKQPCNLAVIDVMMPFMNGFELTKEIRKKYDIPIILLTAKDQITDKETGYEAGTDDYLVKPFEPKELLFRIKALLRRYAIDEVRDIITVGDLMINVQTYEIIVQQRSMFLPPKEFELLVYLAQHKKQILSREQLIEHVWGMDFSGDERTVDVHIKRLREHFKDLVDNVHIKTIRGVGYMLEEQL
ncbi:response regulator transcription factor [Kurthia sibirica]|uniref:Heme response regulator HssR n=1 Tax=Kurthia sibirica TaxID=202750 RepID=A0A2U3AKK4_9BACL|nr:response regulator transcription factor [Kurthia sibirica]PWI25067.1 DNA-binding response regulator [Kurthia sibirica]GEK34233.1 DNA-binding response regulator [Kurthia sibirica]